MTAKTVHCVRNTKTMELFETISGKFCWKAPAHAKNGWMNTISYYDRPNAFDDQDEWEVVECQVIPNDEFIALLKVCGL